MYTCIYNAQVRISTHSVDDFEYIGCGSHGRSKGFQFRERLPQRKGTDKYRQEHSNDLSGLYLTVQYKDRPVPEGRVGDARDVIFSARMWTMNENGNTPKCQSIAGEQDKEQQSHQETNDQRLDVANLPSLLQLLAVPEEVEER